jgi:uncharacterized membrane protein SirB2
LKGFVVPSLMDRAMENLIIRMSGSFAFAAMLVTAGYRVGSEAHPIALPAAVYVIPFFLLAVAANWALSRLNVKRPALIATVILLGVLPVLLALPWHFYVFIGGPARWLVIANAVFGVVTLFMGSVMLMKRRVGTPESREAQAS